MQFPLLDLQGIYVDKWSIWGWKYLETKSLNTFLHDDPTNRRWKQVEKEM